MSEIRTAQDGGILERQLDSARLELDGVASALWGAVGYDQDPFAAALGAFPAPEWRRSDTAFSCSTSEEQKLREKAAILGPGRPKAETLRHLGVDRVDAEIIEPGQLHKTVTELRLALMGEQRTTPLIIFGSDRQIPLWAKGKEEQQFDGERLSTARLLAIGGKDLADDHFFLRAGRFDERVGSGDGEELKSAASEAPSTEFQATEQFLRTVVDANEESILDLGYNPEDGQLVSGQTGQIRRLGTVEGREIILVHKDGSALDTTRTILLMSDIAAAITGRDEVVVGVYTSATYKPSRLMSGIRAGLIAAQAGRQREVVVPTYGYKDLSAVQGKAPVAPSIQNIAGELGKAAKEAQGLRDYLATI